MPETTAFALEAQRVFRTTMIQKCSNAEMQFLTLCNAAPLLRSQTGSQTVPMSQNLKWELAARKPLIINTN